MARFFGISSPSTTCTADASASETTIVAVPLIPRGSRSVPMVGSAMNPRSSDVRVMPSCAPDRW